MTRPGTGGPPAGSLCLITGATSGIGQAAACQLAQRGARVLATARNDQGRQALLSTLRASAPDADVEVLLCDLAELSQVRRLAKEVEQTYGGLDVLINNAGVSKFTYQLTVDGFETTFAVNHLAPFLLTNLLLPALSKARQGRVVTVSSDVHKQVRKVGDLEFDAVAGQESFRPLSAYQKSKLMNVWFTRALADNLGESTVTANCLSPGFVRTRLAREARGGFAVFTKLSRPFQKKAADAARDVVNLAGAPELATVTGKYFRGGRQVEPSALARDAATARRLWELSAELSGLSSS
ncbi:MAG: SDR family NAD(P)-dependent oxidoreductase [Pseudonocardiaceae bacterium]